VSAPRCLRCGEPIGVYEPLVVVVEGTARTTSRAAEPAIAAGPGEHYHLVCHARRHGRRAAEAEEGARGGDDAAVAMRRENPRG
jgi:hypothetical protein